MRPIARRIPFIDPYRSNASIAYAEQVGKYRQLAGRSGEMAS
jgi:hypothetical protein